MKRHFTAFATLLFFGTSILGSGEMASAQQGPPASQQPMEIPAPYPPQQGQYPPPQGYPQQYPPQQAPYPPQGAQYPPQGAPQQGGPGPQGYPQQQGQSDPGAARLSYISGDVSMQHGNSGDWAAATVNTPIVIGDQVSTGKQSRAEIELDHANILRMADGSTANVVNLTRDQIQLQIGQGLVTYDVLKGGEAAVEIQTPNVAIHPQMGEGSYRITVNSDGETIVDVRKGSAEIATPQGSTQVQRDQRITIEGNADNAQYQVSGAPGGDDWDRWNNDRDRTILSAESWNHTNPYYTGTQDLDPYGQWSNVPDYGAVWFPAVAPGWAPYRAGRWVFEPYYGWTWVSYEPWGWAPYHYGRWFVYGGNWGWWPGPVYGGYRPVWAPAYVSFLGFGGGGFGVGIGFGFGGGFGAIGWLPIGPGDRFYPWYGRGVTRVNVVNVYNVHGSFGGYAPLRDGPRAYSNISGALNDERLRGGISSMPSNQFGRGSVPAQQQRFDAGALRQASVMTGSNPVAPARESYRPSDRPVSASSIPSRSVTNQRFFSSSARGGAQPGSNRGGSYGSIYQTSRPAASPSQSSGPGFHSFNSPSGNTGRSYEGQGTPQPRSTYSQPAQPQQREYQSPSRGSSSNYGYSRPPLNMQQPVVTPRGGPYSAPRSYSAPARSAPNSGSRGGYSAPQSHGSSSGGHPSGGHNRR